MAFARNHLRAEGYKLDKWDPTHLVSHRGITKREAELAIKVIQEQLGYVPGRIREYDKNRDRFTVASRNLETGLLEDFHCTGDEVAAVVLNCRELGGGDYWWKPSKKQQVRRLFGV